jgi:hypothetical protein
MFSSGKLLSEHFRKFKDIDSLSKPVYLKRKGKSWKESSRIIGTLTNQPEKFTIEIVDLDTNKTVYTETFNGNLTVYESKWVNQGVYKLIYSAPGYDPKVLKKVKIKAGTDCRIDVIFGTEEFKSRTS